MPIEKVPFVHVFISYSWTSESHEKWVLNLATRLREDGIDVKLDKWDLKEGQDIYSFMESMVTSKEIDKVLIICDKGYKEKAEQRRGGVGTETQIITPEIYGDTEQEKFIPIIAEKKNGSESCIPVYIKTRKYVDMSSEEVYEEGYEALLRNLYNRPQHQKPALGAAPAWLFEEEAKHYKTTNILRQLNDAIDRNPRRIKGLSIRFIDTFLESLDQFQLIEFDKEIPFDEHIVNAINKMLPLRNDYISFVEFLCQAEEVDIEPLVQFFERLYSYTQRPDNITHFFEEQWDHYKFLCNELFLYTVIVLLANFQYKKTAAFLQAEFFIRRSNQQQLEHIGYDAFRFYIRSIDSGRNQRLKLNKVSLTADFLVQRATLKKYHKRHLLDADLLLFYLTHLYAKTFQQHWFPVTYVYREGSRMELLQRLISARFVERAKELFEVTACEELKNKFREFKSDYSRGFSNSFSTIPDIKQHIKPDDICSLP